MDKNAKQVCSCQGRIFTYVQAFFFKWKYPDGIYIWVCVCVCVEFSSYPPAQLCDLLAKEGSNASPWIRLKSDASGRYWDIFSLPIFAGKKYEGGQEGKKDRELIVRDVLLAARLHCQAATRTPRGEGYHSGFSGQKDPAQALISDYNRFKKEAGTQRAKQKRPPGSDEPVKDEAADVGWCAQELIRSRFFVRDQNCSSPCIDWILPTLRKWMGRRSW